MVVLYKATLPSIKVSESLSLYEEIRDTYHGYPTFATTADRNPGPASTTRTTPTKQPDLEMLAPSLPFDEHLPVISTERATQVASPIIAVEVIAVTRPHIMAAYLSERIVAPGAIGEASAGRTHDADANCVCRVACDIVAAKVWGVGERVGNEPKLAVSVTCCS